MSWNKWFFGALGWSMFGPIGGILGYALGSQSNSRIQYKSTGRGTNSGDFGASTRFSQFHQPPHRARIHSFSA